MPVYTGESQEWKWRARGDREGKLLEAWKHGAGVRPLKKTESQEAPGLRGTRRMFRGQEEEGLVRKIL